MWTRVLVALCCHGMIKCSVYMRTVFIVCLTHRVEKIGYQVPMFDFRLPAVMSMSADVHKYGLGAKVRLIDWL